MVRACEIKDSADTEVWGGYFTAVGEFSCGTMHVEDPDVRWPELRLTVDTPEDFELAARIFNELSATNSAFSLRDIVALCRRRPDLMRINEHITQKGAAPIVLKRQGGTG